MTWAWTARYGDGTELREADCGTFTAVDPDRCVEVELVSRRWRQQPVRVSVDPAKGQRAVCFRRREVRVNLTGVIARRDSVVTVVGWESAAGNAYLYCHEDGRIEARRE